MFRMKSLLIGLSIVIMGMGVSGCTTKSEKRVEEYSFPIPTQVVPTQRAFQPTVTPNLEIQRALQSNSIPKASSNQTQISFSQFEIHSWAAPGIAKPKDSQQQDRLFPPVQSMIDPQVSEEPASSTPISTSSRQPESVEFDRFDYYVNFENCEKDILAYLNSGGSPYALEETLDAVEEPTWVKEKPDLPKMDRSIVRVVDVTGDGIREVVVVLRWEPFFSNVDRDRVLLVFSPEGEGYRLLDRVHALDLVWRPYDMELNRIEDINLDGRNEIILTVPDFQGPGGINLFYVTFILQWNGSGLENLIVVPEDAFLQPYQDGAGALNVHPALVDYDGDTKLDIVLRHHGLYPGGSSSYRFAETGPMRGRTEIWSWDGQQYSLTTELDPPEYRIHLLYDADDALLLGNFDGAMSLYLQVIFNDELHSWGTNFEKTEIYERPEERQRLSAYATFRIMLLHILRGNEVEAERDLETLQQYYPADNAHYPFTQMAENFLESYLVSGDVGVACEKASEVADTAVYLGPDTYFHEFDLLSMLGMSYYGWYNRDYTAQDICPFQ